MIDVTRWAQVKVVFEAAAALSGAARDDYVRRHCGSDSELRGEIESLLAAYDSDTDFLESPALVDSAEVIESQLPDARLDHEIGPYLLVRRVGEGGMGVVYEGLRIDGQFQQRVAIKLVKRGMDSDYILRRFRNERQILAALSHPNIAKLLDGGVTPDGSPYFVMEFIEGELIDQYCSTKSLDKRQRIELLHQVARAIAYAHRSQIIHRDIKPGNVLVDSEGTPKLLDFGIAKLLTSEAGEPSPRTVTGLLIITPDYASPEQIRGEPATKRSDIYALGLVLYELTTGCRPKKISDESGLRTLPRDLQLIIRKATHPEATRRYDDMEVLADDLQKFLRGQPVSARPDGLLHRASISARRHSKLLWAGSLLLVAALAALLSWFIQKAPALLPGSRHTVAIVGFQNTTGAPSAAWLSTALTEMLNSEISTGEKIRAISGDTVVRMKLDLNLATAGSYSLATLKRISADIHPDYVIAGSYLASSDKSDLLMRIDLRLQDTRTGESLLTWTDTGTPAELPSIATRAGARLRQVLGVSTVAAGTSARLANPDGDRLYVEGLEHIRRFDPLGARARLERAVVENPEDPLSHAALASALAQLGYEERATEEAKRALDNSSRLPRRQQLEVQAAYYKMRWDWAHAADTYGRLWTTFPDDLDYGIEMATVQSKGGDVPAARRTVSQLRLNPLADVDARVDLAEALAADTAGDSRQELQLAQQAAAKARSAGANQLLAEALYYQAWSKWLLGDLKSAEHSYGEALDIFGEAGNQLRVIDLQSGLASVLLDEGRVTESADMLAAALATARKLGARSLESVVNNNLARCWEQIGQLKKAQQAYQESSAIDRELNQRPNLAIGLLNLAGVIKDQGDLTEGCARARESLEIARSIGRKSTISMALATIGDCELLLGHLENAWNLDSESLTVAREISRKTSIASALLGQAAVLRSQRKWPASEAKYKEASKVASEGGALSKLAEVRLDESQLMADEDRLEDAAKLAKLALTEFQKENSNDGRALAEATIAQLLVREGRIQEAQAQLALARAHMAPGEVFSTRSQVGKAEALVAFAAGRPDESVRILRLLSKESAAGGLREQAWELELLIQEMKPALVSPARVRSIRRQASEAGIFRIARLDKQFSN